MRLHDPLGVHPSFSSFFQGFDPVLDSFLTFWAPPGGEAPGTPFEARKAQMTPVNGQRYLKWNFSAATFFPGFRC